MWIVSGILRQSRLPLECRRDNIFAGAYAIPTYYVNADDERLELLKLFDDLFRNAAASAIERAGKSSRYE